MFAVGLSYTAFIMLRYVPSIPAFWRVFIINGCWILSKAFSASIEITIWLLSFNLLMWCITLIDLQILKNPCIPGIKPTWSWCMIFLICCWILGTLKIHFWVANLILQAIRLASACFQTVKLNLTQDTPLHSPSLLSVYFQPLNLFKTNYLWIYLSIFFFFFFFLLCSVFIAARAFSSCNEWGLLFLEVRGLLIVGASLAEHSL